MDPVSTAPRPVSGGAKAEGSTKAEGAFAIVTPDAADTAEGRYPASPANEAVTGDVPGIDSIGTGTVALPDAFVVPVTAAPPAVMVTVSPDTGDAPDESMTVIDG